MHESMSELWQAAVSEPAATARARAEKRARHRVWTTPDRGRWDLFALPHERVGDKPGKVLDRPPVPPDGFDEFGYDAQGRLVTATFYSMADDDGLHASVRSYKPGEVREVSFTPRGDVLGVGRQLLREGRVVEATSYAETPGDRWTFTTERYEWSSEGIVLIERWTDDSGASEEERRLRRTPSREHVSYDTDGRVMLIEGEVRPGLERVRIYQRMTPATLAQELRAMRRATLLAATELLERAHDHADLWAVAITYDLDDPVPPQLRVCTHAELSTRAHATPLSELDIDPSEWSASPHEIPLDSYGVDAPAALANQVRSEDAQAAVAAEYRKVADKLTAAAKANGHEYVVFALENGAADPIGGIRAALSSRNYKRLVAPLT